MTKDEMIEVIHLLITHRDSRVILDGLIAQLAAHAEPLNMTVFDYIAYVIKRNW
jgi:hypothetical protein